MALTEDDELVLVREARRGSAQAFATLLQMNYDVVLRTLVKLTLDPRAAEDAAQDAMERAIRSFQSYDPDKSRFSTWLITIARNRWLDDIRRNKRLKPLPDVETGEIMAQDPYMEVIENDELLSALNKMEPAARTPITMSYLLGYSYEEISREMKIPLGTVKSRIFNGIRRLRKELVQDE